MILTKRNIYMKLKVGDTVRISVKDNFYNNKIGKVIGMTRTIGYYDIKVKGIKNSLSLHINYLIKVIESNWNEENL